MRAQRTTVSCNNGFQDLMLLNEISHDLNFFSIDELFYQFIFTCLV